MGVLCVTSSSLPGRLTDFAEAFFATHVETDSLLVIWQHDDLYFAQKLIDGTNIREKLCVYTSLPPKGKPYRVREVLACPLDTWLLPRKSGAQRLTKVDLRN